MTTYDVIVVGTGGVGSAAVFHLARRGARVLGLDRFPAGHDRGSSHGHTRIIRQAYCEHPDYVPLVQRAYELWSELQSRRREQLFHQTGLLEVGPPGGFVVGGVLESARQHGLEIERLSADDVARRFPGFAVPNGSAAVFERRGGYLLVERCVIGHVQEAAAEGAELRSDVTVHAWRSDGSGVAVETEAGQFHAGRLIVAAGAWAGQLLSDLGIELRVLRKPLHWFATDDRRYREDQGCPVFLYEAMGGIYYGFPQIDARGVKVAAHHDGDQVADPLAVARDVDLGERTGVRCFTSTCLPGVSGRATDHAVCLYTMSPDDHFIIDLHPQHPQVAFAAGLSGHGFKFTPVLGEALADLALEGRTSLPIEFLHSRRESLRQQVRRHDK